MSTYDQTRKGNTGNADLEKITTERLKKIQAHFGSGPRGDKLKGKVCVITGAGSLKGIGCVFRWLLGALY